MKASKQLLEQIGKTWLIEIKYAQNFIFIGWSLGKNCKTIIQTQFYIISKSLIILLFSKDKFQD